VLDPQQVERTEPHQPSPTQEQVDAYIRSLEWQALLEGIGSPPATQRNIEQRKGPWSIYILGLFWGLIAMALGCFAWLFQLIYEGLK